MPGRERYNAKARASTPGTSRKKGKQKRIRPQDATEPEDSNALLLTPKSQETKENERKEHIRRELAQTSDSKMNHKKKRRLEKYIDKKLRKEERVVIFEKLARSQATSDSTKLQPSSSLGSGRSFTHQERVAISEDKETRHALRGTQISTNGSHGRKRRRISRDSAFEGESSQSEEDVTHLERESSNKAQKSKVAKERPHAPASRNDILSESFGSSDSVYDSPSRPSVDGGGHEDEDEWTGFTQDDKVMEPADGDPKDDDNPTKEKSRDSEDSSGSERPNRRRKPTGFKDWALKQLAAAKGHEPSLSASQPVTLQPSSSPSKATTPNPSQPGTSQKSDPMVRGPLGEFLSFPSTSFAKHVRSQDSTLSESTHSRISTKKNIPVDRPEALQATRLLLPIVAEEQPIMEAILLNPIVIICGETGSGKTTQVPQFLYEAGFGSPGSDNPGMIGITQPRRVAAMSMASRVATELSLPPSRVSYQIRYDATVSPTTSIKFMTDGVLLRELAIDLLLNRYSVIVVDEAHERSMNTDILIGVLSRVVRLREEMWREAKEGIKPLRLIIMSATLRVADFTTNPRLFHTPPPVINIPARQHPVTIHFNKRTVPDYVTEAVRKTVKIHSRLPPGGILIFLTGQNEIKGVCRKLEARFGRKVIAEKRIRQRYQDGHSLKRTDGEVEMLEERQSTMIPKQVDMEAEDVDLGLDTDDHLETDAADTDLFDSETEGSSEGAVIIGTDDTNTPMHIVPLYSLLSGDKQMDVFRPPPLDARLVVVSTNIAETSLTIPGIRYVVDCGRAKERKCDIQHGIQSFQVSWISKASAAQRAGRAGRTGPGHCYRLYSSALFENHFEDFAKPEILRVPIEGVVLQMKSMNIDTVINFPFPTQPDVTSLRRAETILRHLGSLEGTSNQSHITDLGRTMALFPLSPRFSKMLVAGTQHECLPFVIAVVSALSVGDLFLREEALTGDEEAEDTLQDEIFSHIHNSELKEKEAAKARRRAFFISQQTHETFGQRSSDVFRMLSVVGAYEYAGGGHEFCTEQFVRPKAMEEVHKLRYQITKIVQANFSDVLGSPILKLEPPNDTQLKILRQLLTAGFVDQVAVRKDIVDKSTTSGHKYASSRGVPYKALGVPDDVFIHPSSVLYDVTPPEYVVFHEIVRTNRPWIKTLTVINPAWLPKLGPALCTLSKPFKSSGGDAIVIPRYGPDLWELPPMKKISDTTTCSS